MARLTKDGTLQGQKVMTEFVSRAPSKTLIIPGHELVQIIAKVQICYSFPFFPLLIYNSILLDMLVESLSLCW